MDEREPVVLQVPEDGDLLAVGRQLSDLRRSRRDAAEPEAVELSGQERIRQHRGRAGLLLRAWGLTPGGGPRLDRVPRLGRVLVIGGSGSGKSQLAEDLLTAAPSVTYLATGAMPDPASDPDWADRIRRHRERRPAHWRTVEAGGLALATLLSETGTTFLLDSLGTWLTGVLDQTGAWDDAPRWRDRTQHAIATLADAWAAHPGPAVAVTDEVGWGVIPATSAGRLFRDLMGQLNQALADRSDEVLVVVAGQVLARAGDGP